MYKLKVPGLNLPDCVVAESKKEAQFCRQNYLPYLIKPRGWSDTKLLGAIMYQMLKDKFPYIDWRQVLGINNKSIKKVLVMDPTQADSDRITMRCEDRTYAYDESMDALDGDTVEHYIGGGEGYIWGTDEEYIEKAEPIYNECSLDDFFRESTEHVNMEILQELGLLPVFLDDITEAVKRNVIGTSWMDGWNKKLGLPVGDFKYSNEAPNLIVLDVSGSIPPGVSYTMCTLIDMLRTQANAHLIITSWSSRYWDCDEELPTPEELNTMVGGANEASQFNHILEDKIFGKHWGNVIVFGDMHAPTDSRFRYEYPIHDDCRRNTKVDHLMCYDTRGRHIPGYALWAMDHVEDKDIDINDGGWIQYMRRRTC